MIRSSGPNTNFQKAVERLRKNKAALYKRIETQANDPETIKYYDAKGASNFSDVDPDILDEMKHSEVRPAGFGSKNRASAKASATVIKITAGQWPCSWFIMATTEVVL